MRNKQCNLIKLLDEHDVTLYYDDKQRVTTVSVELLSHVDELCQLLAKFPEVRKFRGNACDLSDAGLSCLQTWKQLEFLDITNTQVTSQGLKVLASFPNLRYLRCWLEKNGLLGISNISQCTKLTELLLGNSDLHEGDLDNLQMLKNLEYLQLSHQKLSDSLQVVRYLPHLKKLTLNDTLANDLVCIALSQQGSIEDVSLSNTCITDFGLQHLAGINTIKELSVSSTKVTSAGISFFANHPGIEVIHATGVDIDLKAVEAFSQMKSLQFLGISDKRISKKNLSRLMHNLPKCKIYLESIEN